MGLNPSAVNETMVQCYWTCCARSRCEQSMFPDMMPLAVAEGSTTWGWQEKKRREHVKTDLRK